MTEKKEQKTQTAETPEKEQHKEQKPHKRAGGGSRTDATKPNGEDTEHDTEHVSQSNEKDNKKEPTKEPEKQKPKDDIKTAKAKKEEPEKAKQKPAAPIKPIKGEWSILKFPHLSEKSISNIEMQNKIIFIVKPGSKRSEIKKAVESMFEVKVDKVNMLTTAKGDKKAFVKLKPDYSALDIATRLGMM